MNACEIVYTKLLLLQTFRSNLFIHNFGTHLLTSNVERSSDPSFLPRIGTYKPVFAYLLVRLHISVECSHLYQSKSWIRESVHFLAVTLDLYTHLRCAINSNQGWTSEIITVVLLIELLRATTLLHRTVNKLLTR